MGALHPSPHPSLDSHFTMASTFTVCRAGNCLVLTSHTSVAVNPWLTFMVQVLYLRLSPTDLINLTSFIVTMDNELIHLVLGLPMLLFPSILPCIIPSLCCVSFSLCYLNSCIFFSHGNFTKDSIVLQMVPYILDYKSNF